MRLAVAAVGTATVALSACGVSSDPPLAPATVQAAGWDDESYSFTVESSCGERSFLGRFTFTVHDDVVVDVVPRDQAAKTVVAAGLSSEIPTLDGILAEADAARETGADRVDVELDPADGYPVSIDIDYDAEATDDEACYRVTDLVP